MNRALRKKIKRWAYPIAGFVSGVSFIIQQDPNFYLLTWRELLNRGLKATPFVLAGLAARSMLFKSDDEKAVQQDQMVPGERGGRSPPSSSDSDSS